MIYQPWWSGFRIQKSKSKEGDTCGGDPAGSVIAQLSHGSLVWGGRSREQKPKERKTWLFSLLEEASLPFQPQSPLCHSSSGHSAGPHPTPKAPLPHMHLSLSCPLLPSPWPLGTPETSRSSPAAPQTESPVPVPPPPQRLLSRPWPRGSRGFSGCHGEAPSCLGGKGSGWLKAASRLQAEEHPRSPPPARKKLQLQAGGVKAAMPGSSSPRASEGGRSPGRLAHPVLHSLAHQVLAASAFSASRALLRPWGS